MILVSSVEIPGPAGRLEGLLHRDDAVEPRLLGVVAHPHPLYGGNMHSKVVHRIDRALVAAGGLSLRFNFRGVGRSAGRFDGRGGERDDLRAAMALLLEGHAELPLVLAGFSFGSACAFPVGWSDPRVCALLGVGLLAEAEEIRELGEAEKPVMLIHGEEDRLCPLEPVRTWARRCGERVRLVVVKGSDHFFEGGLDSLETAARTFFEER